MPKKQRNELKAGLFVVLALATLLGVIVWLGAANLFRNPTGQVTFYADAASGPLDLKPGGDVVYNDVNVGKITAVRPDFQKGRTFYDVTFYQDLTFRTDGLANVASGLLGTPRLAIVKLGSPDAPRASPDKPIRIEGGLNQALSRLSEVVDNQFNKDNPDSLLARVLETVGELKTASEGIAKIVADIKPEMDPKQPGTILANVKQTSRHLADTSETVDQYVQADLGPVIVKIRKISTSILETAENLDVSSEKVKILLTANSDGINEMVHNMTAVSANLKAASAEIRRNPWRLFYKPDEQKMRSVNLYDAARAFDDGANQLNHAVTKLKAIQAMAPEDPAAEKELQRIRQHLLDSFDRFKKVEQTLWQAVTENKKP
jgi:ABC-type transporter Mla subunit MlaD